MSKTSTGLYERPFRLGKPEPAGNLEGGLDTLVKRLAASAPCYYCKAMEAVVTLIVIGAILLLLETLLPGMVAGIAGLICLVCGVALAYSRFGVMAGNWTLLGVVAGLVVGFVLWIRHLPRSRFGQMFVTRSTVGELGVEKPELLQLTGTALTNLRPSGAALINGQRVDVVTEGSLIPQGTQIKVVAVEGLRVVVWTV